MPGDAHRLVARNHRHRAGILAARRRPPRSLASFVGYGKAFGLFLPLVTLAAQVIENGLQVRYPLFGQGGPHVRFGIRRRIGSRA
jgi:hypothetical protein